MSNSWPLLDSSPTYYTRPRYGYRHYCYEPEYLGSLGPLRSSSPTYYARPRAAKTFYEHFGRRRGAPAFTNAQLLGSRPRSRTVRVPVRVMRGPYYVDWYDDAGESSDGSDDDDYRTHRQRHGCTSGHGHYYHDGGRGYRETSVDRWIESPRYGANIIGIRPRDR
jgi:hypothetical protein